MINKVLRTRPSGKSHMRNCEDNTPIKFDFGETRYEYVNGRHILKWGPMTSFCEHVDVSSGFIKQRISGPD
jgi:hypothetical protein